MDQNIHTSRLLEEYPGIEGFYFLTIQGELGYIAKDGLSLAKETFLQAHDPVFLKQHPKFTDELHQFHHDTRVLTLRYLDTLEPDAELGYVRRTEEGDDFPWHTATLVFHKEVLASLRRDDDLLYEKGVKDPFKAEAENESLQELHGIHHGMDGLANHTDAYSVFHYFPVLFYWSPAIRSGVRGLTPDVETAPLRILNLMWRPPTFEYSSGSASSFTRCETVYSVLRENLERRGTIDRSKRIENRFSIE